MRDALAAALRAVPGLELAVVFGSRARGDARAESDLDLAVLGTDELDAAALAADASRATGIEVHVVSLAGISIPLLSEVVSDGIVTFERSPGRGALWRSRALASLETDLPWYRRMRDAWLEAVARRGLVADGE
jgi:predicted nucleotidyltransferase